mgnify:CR=1 FL=1
MLTSSLVGALETEALLAKIKKVISDQIAVNDVLVAFWNEEGPWSAFSEKVPLQQQLSLKMFAQQMQQNNEKHSFHDHANNYFLTVWFNHSDKRFGFIQLRNDSPFSRNDLVKAKACATQSSLALENARLYTEVNLLAEKAQAASQAKSDFLAQVSHEVRTPMNGILGMNQLLMASELSQDQRQYTEAVAESGSHLLHIINDILDFSKIEAGQLSLEHRPFDLLDLLDDILGMFSATAKQKGLLFYLDIDSDLTSARIGDALRLKQLMMNLLSNAFKFTQTGKVILSVSYASGGVVVSVTDTGTGVSAEQQSALFEPFTQADSSITRTHGGTGLGLSIVKQLCELMGGHVAIESELGKGSCFSCHLALDVDSCADESLTTNSPVVGVIAGDSKLTAALIAQCEAIGCHSKMLNTGEPLTGLSVLFYLVTQPLSEQCVESLREYATKADETSLQMVVIKTEAVDLSTEVADGLVLNFPLKSAQLKQLLGLGTSIEVSEKPSTFNQVASKGKDVLVLEDNLINQELMRHLLEKVGHRIHVFDHAKDALAALNGGLTCDLMLVDYHLPDVSGIEFINQARLLMPAVPCAILTADVSDELSVLCEGHHIEHVFTKPLNLDDLYQLIVD